MLQDHGKTRYIDSTLWHTITDQELYPLDDGVEEDAVHQAALNARQTPPPVDPLIDAVFSPEAYHVHLLELHPGYNLATKLWDVFTTHVDPLTKICHIPTTKLIMQSVALDPANISTKHACLVVAVYLFAVVAISEQEYLEMTGRSRQVLWNQYHDASRQALVNAHFLRTAENGVFQACVLFLLAVRPQYDARTFWTLTGVALRIAQRLGLHRDGNEFGMRPFVAEMRRRLFWQRVPLERQECAPPRFGKSTDRAHFAS